MRFLVSLAALATFGAQPAAAEVYYSGIVEGGDAYASLNLNLTAFQITLESGRFTTTDLAVELSGRKYQWFGPDYYYIDNNVADYASCYLTAPGACLDRKLIQADQTGSRFIVRQLASYQSGGLYRSKLSIVMQSYFAPEIESITALYPGYFSFIGFTDAPDGTRFTISSLAGGIPEPSAWALLVTGFGVIGIALRRRGASKRVRNGVLASVSDWRPAPI